MAWSMWSTISASTMAGAWPASRCRRACSATWRWCAPPEPDAAGLIEIFYQTIITTVLIKFVLRHLWPHEHCIHRQEIQIGGRLGRTQELRQAAAGKRLAAGRRTHAAEGQPA